MAKKQLEFVGITPDDMSQGVPDLFRACISLARYVPRMSKWDARGVELDEPEMSKLALRVELIPHPESGYEKLWLPQMNVGDLENFWPVNEDGEVVEFEEWDGDIETQLDYAGTRITLSPDAKSKKLSGINYKFFLEQLLEAGFSVELMSDGDISHLEGADCLFTRLEPPKFKGGRMHDDDAGESNKRNELPVPTEYFGQVDIDTYAEDGGASSGKGKSKAKARAKAITEEDESPAPKRKSKVRAKTRASATVDDEEDGDEDDNSEVDKAIDEAIVDIFSQDASPISLKGLGVKISRNVPSTIRRAVLARIKEESYLVADERPFIYDEDELTIEPLEEE